jgi:hypothetical protein
MDTTGCDSARLARAKTQKTSEQIIIEHFISPAGTVPITELGQGDKELASELRRSLMVVN